MSINDKIEKALELVKQVDDVVFEFSETRIKGDDENWDEWDEFYEQHPKFGELIEWCNYLTSRVEPEEADL